MTTIPEQYNQLLETIAKKWFDVETLETRGSDGLDFYDVSVSDIEDLIEALYQQGNKYLERVKEFKDSADGVA